MRICEDYDDGDDDDDDDDDDVVDLMESGEGGARSRVAAFHSSFLTQACSPSRQLE